MDIINISKTKQILKTRSVYVSLVLAFIVMMIFFPNEGKFKYEYQKGRPWMYETLISPIDFPILKTQQELLQEREQMAAKVIPYFVYDNAVEEANISGFAKVQAGHNLSKEEESAMVNALRKAYQAGILPDNSVLDEGQYSRTGYIFVQRNKRASEQLISNLYTVKKAEKSVQSELTVVDGEQVADSLLGVIQLKDYIKPNLAYSEQNTELLHRQAIDYISPTKGMIYTGQLIVNEGETVTSDIEQLLDSYKAESELSLGYTGSWQIYIAHAIIILMVLLLIYFTIYFVDFEILKETNKFSFILVIAIMAFLITVFVRNMDAQFLFMVPYAVFTLYMSAFFTDKLVFPLYMIMLLPLLIIAEYGLELYVMNVLAGGIALVSFSYLYRGWLQFMNAFIVFIGIFVVHIAFRLLENGSLAGMNYMVLAFLVCNALFVVAAYPLVSLLEKIFSLVSMATLKDLSDTNNSLLQEMARKAPGTFQHSLQVANLAERAVHAIRGNSRLVKVGAMYHDIGKINNPLCFIENQAPGVDYHKGLTPQESAREIMKHVPDGVELAKKHKLPQMIVDFITSHHGQSQTLYFYNQYCNNGGDPNNIKDFTYQGTLPKTKEQVVVMMADAVEAASRTLKDYSAESISNLVDSITGQRLSDSQLAEADISIKDINIVRAVFKKHLGEIYHQRIKYPAKKTDNRRTVPVSNGTAQN